ncbi:MAG: DUF4164 domain-containing protein, partial [Hyphomonadaceae bacterium]|nr:DUF4164 domain-containing protein [Hyphomonadaceae bacterium]
PRHCATCSQASKCMGMSEGPDQSAEIDNALRQLEASIDRLEGRLDGLFERLEGHRSREREADALRVDRARLAGDLDAAKARERELQRLADEASEALGAAISEVREALGKV